MDAMKLVFAVALALMLPWPLAAQPLAGFASFGVHQDTNDQSNVSVSGGVTLDLPTEWVSAGAMGDLFMSWPYFGGRATLFGQGNLMRRQKVRPFVLGGVGWGEFAGPMFGGGIEIRSAKGLGLRVSVQDYLAKIEGFDCGRLGYDKDYCESNWNGGRPYTKHQVTVLVGVAWR